MFQNFLVKYNTHIFKYSKTNIPTFKWGLLTLRVLVAPTTPLKKHDKVEKKSYTSRTSGRIFFNNFQDQEQTFNLATQIIITEWITIID